MRNSTYKPCTTKGVEKLPEHNFRSNLIPISLDKKAPNIPKAKSGHPAKTEKIKFYYLIKRNGFYLRLFNKLITGMWALVLKV